MPPVLVMAASVNPIYGEFSYILSMLYLSSLLPYRNEGLNDFGYRCCYQGPGYAIGNWEDSCTVDTSTNQLMRQQDTYAPENAHQQT